jgi:hypothetical protein
MIFSSQNDSMGRAVHMAHEGGGFKVNCAPMVSFGQKYRVE